jgi:hypothetical protein
VCCLRLLDFETFRVHLAQIALSAVSFATPLDRSAERASRTRSSSRRHGLQARHRRCGTGLDLRRKNQLYGRRTEVVSYMDVSQTGREQRVTALELFFDLVVVFAITQVTDLITTRP